MDEAHWELVVGELAPNARCVTPVLPLGAHRLPMPSGSDLTPTGVADLIVDFLDALGLTDVTLVGNDTGGALAQLVAASHPERISRLVLVSCDAYENFPPGLPGKTMALACRIPGALRMCMWSLRLAPMRRLPMTFGRMSERPIPDRIFGGWLRAFEADRRVRRDVHQFMSGVDAGQLTEAAGRLPALGADALVVWAEKDRVMPREHADRLATALGGAPVTIIAGSGTLVPLDRPAELADVLGAFLANRGSRSSTTSPAASGAGPVSAIRPMYERPVGGRLGA
jgi:pimeloyl-ACP methyl ester carboxylesterase